MTIDNGIQELLDKIDSLTELIANAKISERYRDIQHKKSETLLDYESSIQKVEREIEALEKVLDNASKKAEAVEKTYNDKVESLTTHKGEIALNDIEYDRAYLSTKDLEAQVKEKERELELERQSENTTQNPSGESLPLVIYEGIGLTFPLDPDGQVRKAVIRSKQHDILSLPLEDDYIFQTANRIWDFISK